MKTIKTLKEVLDKDFMSLNIREEDLSEASEDWSWELIDTPVLFKSSTVGDVDIMFSCVVLNGNKEVISRDSTMINITWKVFVENDKSNLDGLLLSLKIELRKLILQDYMVDVISKDCIDDLFGKK